MGMLDELCLGELEVVVTGFDRVPVELCLYLRAVRGDVVVTGALGLPLDEVPIHCFGKFTLVAVLLADEIAYSSRHADSKVRHYSKLWIMLEGKKSPIV
jgi:hypothetical protein